MSIHVMSMVYRARLGSITRKAIALKLASCAEDDGTRIYPSTATIASEVECGVRVVQYTLREFEQEKLLIVVTRGGRGPRSTTHYRMNLARLAALTPADDASSKGAPDAPSKKDAVGAPIAARKGAPDAKKGAPGAPDSSEIRQKEDPLYSPSVPLGDDDHRRRISLTTGRCLTQIASGSAACAAAGASHQRGSGRFP